ncbi:hypothetical protein [Oryzifoliimicrobium ureilyticus]|uniref:hypothetical protein n=1 Tax=Oryzifoliimicrobium ureilyticus TaxID=3113724 RepID=UPI00307632BA
MEGYQKSIRDMSVDEREEALAHLADTLEGSAYEAFIEGQKGFATLSRNMATAIKANADELARFDIDAADKIVQHARYLLHQFRIARPHKPVSMAVH